MQYNSWYTGAGIEWTGKKSYWREEGEEVGDGRTEGLSKDEGQAVVSLNTWCWWQRIGSLLDSSLSKPVEKMIQWCLGSSSFLVIDDKVALDCILNGCCNLRVYWSTFRSCAWKTNSTSSNKIILPFPVSWISSVLQFLFPLFSLCPFCGPPSSSLEVFIRKNLASHTKKFSEVALLQI